MKLFWNKCLLYPGFKKIDAIVNYPPKYNQMYPNMSLTAFYMHARMTFFCQQIVQHMTSAT